MTDKYLPASQPVVGALTEEQERKAFEADAEPMGFDLTRITLPTPEPWAEYESMHTGHRWGGWLARADLHLSAAPVAPEPMADECAHTELGSRAYKAAYDAGYRARAVEAAEAASQPAEAVSETEFLALVRSYGDARQDHNLDLAMGWIRDIQRAILALAAAPTQAPEQASPEMPSKARKLLEAIHAGKAFADGDAEATWIAQSEHLNCPHCGGSGHIDDVQASPEVAEPASDQCQSCGGQGGTQTGGVCAECYGQGTYSGAREFVSGKAAAVEPAKVPRGLLARATALHEKAGMPWADAEELALSEAGIDGNAVDALIGECGYAGLQSLLTDEDELRQFTRSVIVHATMAAEPVEGAEPIYQWAEDNTCTKWRDVTKDEWDRVGTMWRRTVYTHPAPASAQAGAVPDMFWNHDDAERCRDSIFEVVNYEMENGGEIGSVIEIQQAVRLENIKVRVIADPDDKDSFDFEVLAAPKAGAPGAGHGSDA